MKARFLLVGAALFVFIALVVIQNFTSSKQTFAQCLSTQGAVMYGVDTCTNCVNQKNILGNDFKNVHYVNCDFNKPECEKKGISVYPVWSLGNKVLIGTQSLPELAKFSGCKMVTSS